MNWLHRLATWFYLGGLRQRLYRKAYRQLRDQARIDSDAIRADAGKDRDRVLKEARDDAKQIRSRAAAEATKRINKEAAEARETAVQKARSEIAEERQRATAAGRREGWLAAYAAAAVNLGIPAASNTHEVDPSVIRSVDLNRLYPNIYRADNKWVVRVVVDGERHVREFEYTRGENVAIKLIDAINYRNMIAPPTRSHHEALYVECETAAIEELGARDGLHVRVRSAELFYTRIMHDRASSDRVQFAGDDPEDRFNINNTAILTCPWVELLRANQRLIDAFESVGLSRDRVVRDLLLFTGDELLEAQGFGDVSLRKLRQGLADFGLALWGDPIPAAPRRAVQPGEREFRGIELGDDDAR